MTDLVTLPASTGTAVRLPPGVDDAVLDAE